MTQLTKIEIPVEPATAAALSNTRRREAVGRLIDRLVRPGSNDPLIALFEHTAMAAQQAGMTTDGLEAELTAYNEERRA